MINYIISKFQRPEKGWDPVPKEYYMKYATSEWERGIDKKLIDTLDFWIGGFKGKNILDLGGGPGQYAVEFAKRGANVTWHDVSNRYLDFASNKANENNVSINFSLGYMDEANKLLHQKYDLVFNRICWNYCFSDFAFIKVIFDLLNNDGVAYIDTTHSIWKKNSLSLSSKIRTILNNIMGIKIGHPFPPHGRLSKIIQINNIKRASIDYSMSTNDKIIFQKNERS